MISQTPEQFKSFNRCAPFKPFKSSVGLCAPGAIRFFPVEAEVIGLGYTDNAKLICRITVKSLLGFSAPAPKHNPA